MSDGGTVVVPDGQGDYPDEVLADPAAAPDFTPGEVVEPGDPDDDGHDQEAEG